MKPKRKSVGQLAAERLARSLKRSMERHLTVRAITVNHVPAVGQVNFSVPVSFSDGYVLRNGSQTLEYTP